MGNPLGCVVGKDVGLAEWITILEKPNKKLGDIEKEVPLNRDSRLLATARVFTVDVTLPNSIALCS